MQYKSLLCIQRNLICLEAEPDLRPEPLDCAFFLGSLTASSSLQQLCPLFVGCIIIIDFSSFSDELDHDKMQVTTTDGTEEKGNVCQDFSVNIPPLGSLTAERNMLQAARRSASQTQTCQTVSTTNSLDARQPGFETKRNYFLLRLSEKKDEDEDKTLGF